MAEAREFSVAGGGTVRTAALRVQSRAGLLEEFSSALLADQPSPPIFP
jgi:hypothetical protein